MDIHEYKILNSKEKPKLGKKTNLMLGNTPKFSS